MRDRELLIKLRVGVFVLVLLLLFVAFVLTIGVRTRLFEEQYTLRAAFRDVQGLVVGAPVRLAGLTVGTVRSISFGSDLADPRIHVGVAVDRQFQSRIREDSEATIGTLGLVGDKVFEITVGSESAKVLQPGETLRAMEPVDFPRLVARGGEVLESLAGASRALKAILGSVEEGRGLLPTLISDKVGGDLIRDLAVVAKSLRRVSERAEEGEGLLGALMAKKDVLVIESLHRSAARLEETLKEMQEGDGLLHALVFEKGGKDLVGEIRQTVTGLEQVVARLQAGEGILGALLTDSTHGKNLQDLQAVVADLKRITGALAEGEGTLGALIHDPTVYEDLSSLLRGAERSWVLRGLIRSGVRRGRETAQEDKQ
ncbi:MAG: MlaD family protein [Candidatus Methylomirabilales bacterium]